MKRMTYVDKSGNAVDQSLENRRPLLRTFFVIGTILPIVIMIFIIVTVVRNIGCNKVYNNIKAATLNYLKETDELPTVEGLNTTVNISDLYSEQYLTSSQTKDNLCSGKVKVTKYKDTYIYTLDVHNCNSCSVNNKYKGWSSLQNNYPKGKAIVDVIPYYNYYERQANVTSWSKYYDEDELADEESEYGIRLPLNTEELPEIPAESSIMTIENDTTYYYRYSDRSWKWYDIVGNYSGFSSEQPAGFANKDQDTEKYTAWSEYSLDYPEEKPYREIQNTTGYKFYYTNDKGKKIYYNSGKYSDREEVNTEKYSEQERETAKLYKYRDKVWRWYNGQKRKYSALNSRQPVDRPYKDEETETLSSPSSWEAEKHTNDATAAYRLEESKLMTRFRVKYEILSLLVLDSPLKQKEFEKKAEMSIENFSEREDTKLDITYKFRYRKS